MTWDLHSQAELSCREKTQPMSRDGKVQDREECIVQLGSVLRQSSENCGSTSRTGCMSGWTGAGDLSLEGETRCLQPPGWEVRGWWRWRCGEGKGVRNVSTVLPNASKSPWLILHSHSHTPLHWRHHTTCPAPSLEAYHLIFQVHNFLPNFLSSTHQSRSTAQLRSLAVPLGLGCSLALSPSSAPSSAEAENNSPHLRALTRRFGQKVKPRGGPRHWRKEQSGWDEPSWGLVLCAQPGLSFTRLRG